MVVGANLITSGGCTVVSRIIITGTSADYAIPRHTQYYALA